MLRLCAVLVSLDPFAAFTVHVFLLMTSVLKNQKHNTKSDMNTYCMYGNKSDHDQTTVIVGHTQEM